MKTILLLLALTALSFLTSCASFEETAQHNCLSYGFTPGTVEYAQCLQNDLNARRTNAVNYINTHY